MQAFETLKRFAESGKKIPGDRFKMATQWVVEMMPPQLQVAHHASMWFTAVAMFREDENESLREGNFESQREYHRFFLNNLCAEGQWILLHALDKGLPPTAKFKIADIESTLESLRESERCENGPRNHPAVEKAIMALFDEK
ncbi:MAG TPA: hypothetical protein VHH73_08750 [Verrucomicrobiae bacterium]|nr:hypothetical protein [Verrucomicrobiae bacterium]